MASLSKLSERKQRLLACACCYRASSLLSDQELLHVISVAEDYSDGKANSLSLRNAWRKAQLVAQQKASHEPTSLAAWAAARTATATSINGRAFDHEVTLHLSKMVAQALFPDLPDDQRIERDKHQSILEDIEPFRSVTFHPNWRTSTVVSLAQSMYESRDFSTMPILSDALQDAGCENEDILNHCRGDDPHVRGCWVVDLILGKE